MPRPQPKKPIAVVLVEAKPGSGRIIVPGSKEISLAEFKQKENVTIPGHVVVHEGQTLRLGRDDSNEMVLDIPNVSRFHAIFSSTGSKLRVSDLSSTNGTFVNGNPITAPVRLNTGDVVDIGPARLKIELLSDLETNTNLTMLGTKFDPITTTSIVTVLVADIVQYTKLSEILPPEDVTKMLQHWFELVTRIIGKFDGKVDKYIGDCVMAFWKGTGQNTKILATEATRAALEIKKQTRQLSRGPQWPHGDYQDWDCRVSLNTGQVMIGAVGARGSRNFTVLGDVVNVAFRLNNVAGERGYDFVMGDATANLVGDVIKVTKLGPVDIKGRNQKVVAYTMSN